jgi:hypothetical protein
MTRKKPYPKPKTIEVFFNSKVAKLLLVGLLALMLIGCGSTDPQNQAKGFMETMEFGEGEVGCFRLAGMLDLNPIPFMSSNVNIVLVKQTGDEAPDC